MTQRVNVPGVGTVNFPDNMSPEQITHAIETDILPKKPAAPELFSDRLRQDKPLSKVLAGIPEAALQMGSGVAASILGGGTAALQSISNVGLKLAGQPEIDTTKTIRDAQERLTFQPQTEAGKLTSGLVAAIPDWVNRKIAAPAGEKVAEVTGVPELGATVETLPDMALALAGRPRAAIQPATVARRPAGNRLVNRVGDLFRGEEGARRIVARHEQKAIGSRADQLKAAEALESAEELVPGSRPTAAEATAGKPVGTVILAEQNQVAGTPGGPSIRFNERKAEQIDARKAAADKVEADLGPHRERILSDVNRSGAADANLELPAPPGAAPHIGLKPGPVFAEIRALLAEPKISKLETKLLQGVLRDLRLKMKVPEWAVEKLNTARQELASARAAEVDPVVLKVMEEDLAELTRNVNNAKLINAEALYTIRKEIGKSIKLAQKKTADWDAQTAAHAQGSVNKAIDKAIFNAGGKDWRSAYMDPYAKRMQVISADAARSELAGKPLQKTRLTEKASDVPQTPSVFSRIASLARYLLQSEADLSKPRLAAIAAEHNLNPALLARALREGATKPGRQPNLVDRKALTALTSGMSPEERRRRMAELLRQQAP